MATGDITNPKRPRYQSNERFDVVDADAASQSIRNTRDALDKATLFTPRAAGSSVPVGMILQGGSTTVNPTGPTDGKLRVNTELLVAIDANGRTLIKEAGTTLDVNIPTGGNQQVYLNYRSEEYTV